MSLADRKVINYMLQGPAEINSLTREIDLKLLGEGLVPRFKPLYKNVSKYFLRYKAPPSYDILLDQAEDEEDTKVLSEIKDSYCKSGEYAFYVDKVRERYNEFLLKKLSEQIILSDEDIGVEEINQEVSRIFSKIERLKKGSVLSEGGLADSAEDRYNSYKHKRDNPGQVSGVLSGYTEIDEYIYGISDSEFMVICGASSSGKSMLMMNMAINAWLGSNDLRYWNGKTFNDDGKNIIYVSLEMSKEQIEHRIDANVARIRHKNLVRATLSEDELKAWGRCLKFQSKYEKKKRFYIIDMPRGSRTIDIEGRLDAISAEFKPDLVCIDYIGIMKPNVEYGSDWLGVGHVAGDVHELCRRKNLPVISAAQRKSRDKKSKKQFNDVEEIGRSKMIGDNSNIVLLIEKRDEEHLREDLCIHVVKNRDGDLGTVYLEKELEKSRLNNLSEDWGDDAGTENDV